jgi:hypothetical protein
MNKMTITPTHLSVAGIAFWFSLPQSERVRFQQAKKLFWLVLVFSIIPDFDVFLGQHRGLSHSIIPPLILMVLGSILHSYFQYYSIQLEDTKREKYAFWGRCVLYIGGIWLFHTSLDWDWPLTLFYPLSDRAYQIKFEYILSLVPWLFFPAMIIGIGLRITGVSYLQGLSTFFINLPPDVRQQIFGGPTAAFTIPDFVLHVVLFSIFLVYVARPMFPHVDFKRFRIWKQPVTFDRPLLGLGVILILSGTMTGPMIGLQTTDSSSISGTFQISENTFSPTIALSFESTVYLFQPGTNLHIDGLMNITSDNSFNHSLFLIDPSDYTEFTNNISQIFSDFPLNSSQNEQMFRTRYQSYLNALYMRSYSGVATSDENISQLTLNLPTGSYVLMGVLTDWNSTQVLNGTWQGGNVRLEIVFSTSRITMYVLGVIFLLGGIVLIVFAYRLKKGQGLKFN